MITEKQQNVLDLLRQIYKITNELLEEYGNMPNVAQEMEYPLWLRATNTTVLCASLAVFINLIVLN